MGKPWKSKNKPLFVSTDGSRLKIPELAGREEELGDQLIRMNCKNRKYTVYRVRFYENTA